MSGRGGQWGQTPDEQSVRGLLTQLHCVAVVTGRGQIRPAVSSQTGCPGPCADSSPSLPAPFPDSALTPFYESRFTLSHTRVPKGSPWDTRERSLCFYLVCVLFPLAKLRNLHLTRVM